MENLFVLHSFLKLFHSAHQGKPKKRTMESSLTHHLCACTTMLPRCAVVCVHNAAQVVSSCCLPSGASQPVPTGTTTRSSSSSHSCAATHHAIRVKRGQLLCEQPRAGCPSAALCSTCDLHAPGRRRGICGESALTCAAATEWPRHPWHRGSPE